LELASTEQLIRVYDPTRVSTIQHAKAYTLGLVALSPDGTRAITGQILCDAHTGEELAHVGFNGVDGQWFQGGPPRNCRALCDEVVVEIMPFGYHLWDSTTGEILVDDRNHRASVQDTVAFAPNGRTHAVATRDALRIYDNHSLAILHEQPLVTRPLQTILRFSRDGSTLWCGDGEATAQPIHLRPGRSDPPETHSAAIADGIVTLGDLALPIDDSQAEMSADGRVILGAMSHYVRS